MSGILQLSHSRTTTATDEFRVVGIKETAETFLQEHGVSNTDLASGADLRPARLPDRFSMGENMTPARDQARGSTCTSFGVTSCLEYFHNRDLSEAHLTHFAESRFDECTPGLALGPAMLSASREGLVDEFFWPYDDSKICWATPPDIRGKPRYKFASIQWLFRRSASLIVGDVTHALSVALGKEGAQPSAVGSFSNDMKIVLAIMRRPVAVEVPVWWTYSGHFSAGWDFGPHVNMPTPVDMQEWLAKASTPPFVDGWHLICLTGYDDAHGRFFFKNSWDTWWGTEGFGTIPYEYIDSYARFAMHGGV